MVPLETLQALLLGLVEGLTEFIPVSSTAHLLLLGRALGFENTGFTFEILIQLGAILAIITVYWRKCLDLTVRLPTDPSARKFALGVLLAFLPAAILGASLHGVIKGVFFQTPVLICVMLILGGFVLLWADKKDFKTPHQDAFSLPLLTALKIGLFQCLALVPGTSRSGATIVGALLLGVEKKAAAEFSFFLALPTMSGAFAYDLYKNWGAITERDIHLTMIGFVAAFGAGAVVVKGLLKFVGTHGFAPFAWWRIAVGALGLLLFL